ncbi:MAG TPA: hypothetical protein VF794_11180 [Archangium sp.]|uniref:hypothetical protein n=1 Tax=Archangium sp. TaxID=1872627 RepID=UPI002ED921C4
MGALYRVSRDGTGRRGGGEGWKGLTGTIEPDIILLDEKGFIVHVYDLKFPCPETNSARWETYAEGRWRDELQGDVYEEILGVKPRLVSPRDGIVPIKEE